MTRISLPADLRSLYLSKPNNEKEGLLQKQASTRILKGLGIHFNKFIDFPENLMLQTGKYKNYLNEIISKINFLVCELNYTKPPKEDFCTKLDLKETLFKKYITQLKEAESVVTNDNTSSKIKNDHNSINKLNVFSNIISDQAFKANKTKFELLFKKSHEELNRLIKKIKLYQDSPGPNEKTLKDLVLRVRKSVPHYILEDALAATKKKEETRQKNFENLKSNMQTAQFACNEVEILSTKLEWMNAILPELNEYADQLPKLSELSTSLMNLFEKLHTEKIYADFKVKEKTEEKRDFDKLSAQFEEYKKDAKQMNFLEKEITRIDSFGKKFLPRIDDTLTKITNAINEISQREYSDLNDEDYKIKLNTQKKLALETYEGVRKEITKKCNNFFLELDKLKHQVATFNKLINLSAKLTEIYLKAEKVHQTLRFTRLKENDQQLHTKAFKEQQVILNEIHDIIYKKTANDFYISTSSDWSDNILTQDEFKNSVFIVQKVKSSPSLKKQILELNGEKFNIFLTPTRQSAKEIGLQGKDADRIKLLENQNTLLEDQLTGYKKKLNEAFTKILQAVCQHATDEFNRMGEALATYPTKYKANFTKAYNLENVIGQTAQKTGTAIIEYVSGSADESIPYIPVKSPFDSKEGY